MKTKKCIRKSSEPVTVSVVSFLICYVSVVLNDLFPFFFSQRKRWLCGGVLMTL